MGRKEGTYTTYWALEMWLSERKRGEAFIWKNFRGDRIFEGWQV